MRSAPANMLSAEGGPVAQAKPRIVCAAAVFALVLAAALVLGVFCAPAAHAKTVTSDEVADKWVFIGDSYATVKVSGHYVKKSWPEYLKSKLKIPASKLRIIRKYGSGFALGNEKWSKLIKKRKYDERVGHVLIVGGAGNDLDYSLKSVAKGYGKLVKAIRKKFPNARIAHAITSWDFYSSWYQTKIRSRYKWYRALAAKHGVLYLKGCESAVRKHESWVCDDGNHPNKKGCKGMTKIIYKRMKALKFI